MEKAKGLVNIALEAKTTWNTKDLITMLDQVYQTTKFSNPMAMRAFNRVYGSFKDYVCINNLHSMGRNQFLQWFRIECVSQMNTAMFEAKEEVPSPKNAFVDFATVDEETPNEELMRLRTENLRLIGQLTTLQNQFANIEPKLKAFTALLKDFKI